MYIARRLQVSALPLRRLGAARAIHDYPRGKGGKLLTPYIRFAQEVRDQIVAENSGLKITEVGRIIGERWRELTEEAREKYKAEYREAKEREA